MVDARRLSPAGFPPTRFAPARVVPLWLLLLALFAGCKSDYKTALPTVQMRVGNRAYTLEVADTETTRQYGLMRRDYMPADHGMIFVFDREAPLGFYMKNTRIPLDILYLDRHGSVVSIKQMKPYDTTTVPSDAPAQYAIELNKGQAEVAGVKVGTQVQIPGTLKAKD